MKKPALAAYTFAAILSGSSGFAQTPPPIDPSTFSPPSVLPERKTRTKPEPAHVTPSAEDATDRITAASVAGFATKSAFSASSPALITPFSATNLSPPVTISYSGSSAALLINATGTGRGAEVHINNTHNTGSALFGQTDGSGAGLTGYNGGTAGSAGKFGIINGASLQPGVWASTNGGGSAVLGQITKASSGAPALLGTNQGSNGIGVGVEGQGGAYGMLAFGGTYGLYANGSSSGVWGLSQMGEGVYGETGSGAGVSASADTGYGVYASSNSGTAVYATSFNSGAAISAHAMSGNAIYAKSDSGTTITALSTNAYAVLGEDLGSGYGVYGFSESGNGVYGYSAYGFAGYFAGKVAANSYTTLSDRNVKTQFKAIDGHEVLARVDQLPISSWVFKDDPSRNHVGPMAQDFHAAFHLDGNDDKHINLTDIAGVSLAAIKELSQEMKEKDAEIAALKGQLKSMNESFAARLSVIEQHQTRTSLVTAN